MGLWQRLKRVFRSMVGSSVSAMESPEMILEQSIRELNDQVPRMNQSLGMVRTNVTLLEKDLAKSRRELADCSARIEAAIEAGNDDAATHYAVQMQQAQAHLKQTEGQLEAARAAYERSLEVKQLFIREKNRRIKQAQQALQEHRRAQWQAKVADVLESFEVAGIDATHQEMIRKIEEKTAMSQARLEVALDSVDERSLRFEEDLERARARELVESMKIEMGQRERGRLEETRPEALPGGEGERRQALGHGESKDLTDSPRGEPVGAEQREENSGDREKQ